MPPSAPKHGPAPPDHQAEQPSTTLQPRWAIVHINWGPEMEEVSRGHWRTTWCFKCRKHLPHDKVCMAPIEPSYYGPHINVECAGCGQDHTHFPGTWDGPTLEPADA